MFNAKVTTSLVDILSVGLYTMDVNSESFHTTVDRMELQA